MKTNTHKNICSVFFPVFLLFMACFSPVVCHAASVTSETAVNMVRGWLNTPGTRLSAGLGDRIDRVESFGDPDAPVFFVVYLRPSGFVIVPGDNRLEPVAGFSSGAEFEASSDNPLGALVLSDIPARMDAVSEMDDRLWRGGQVTGSIAGNRKKWEKFLANPGTSGFIKAAALSDIRVEPLLRSKWNQSGVGTNLCYNYFTPNNYPAGCGATALAQMMRYFEYPTNAVGTNLYTVDVDGMLYDLPLRGRDGSGEPYHWQGMPYRPEESTSDVERRAIGSLCRDAGLAIGSSYTIAGTASYPDYAQKALTNTFFFRNAVFGYNNNANIGPGIYDMINPNLDAGSPVILAVVSSNTGHAVVCDGYGYDNGTIYHHINMGWGGAFDAWYNLPDTAGYTSVYACVYNVFPDGSGEIISGRVVDHSGAAMQGVRVDAALSGGGAFVTNTFTDSRGVYAFRNMASDSSFTIAVSNSGDVFQSALVATGVSSNYAEISGNCWGVDFTAGSTNPPLPPGGVSAGAGVYDDKIRVTWDVVAAAATYEVWRGLNSSVSAAERIAAGVSGMVYDDFSCEPGVIYHYWVVSVNKYGTSGFGAPAYGWRALAAPDGVSASAGVYAGKIVVAWNAVTNAQGYEVWRGTESDAGLAVKTAYVEDLSWHDTDAAPGVVYYYRVKARNTNSTSAFSAAASGWILPETDLYPVYRLYSYGAPESTYAHLWTMNAVERDVLASYPSWQYEGVAWRAFALSTQNSTPLYRLYAPSVRKHLYTINVTEYVYLSDVDPAWNGEGVQYHVLAEGSGGAVPVYRFYHAELYLHHFTADLNEKNTIEANPQWGYEYEGIGFYVFPADSGN